MKNHRQHRESPVDASRSIPPIDQVQSQSSVPPSNDSIARRIVWRLLGVLGASLVLGFAFNATSPVGVQFGNVGSGNSPAAAHPNSIPSAPVIAATNQVMAVLPPVPPRVKKTAPTQTTSPAPSLISSPALSAVPQPLATTPFPSPQPLVEPNPASIHWLQAKPLVAAGQAVLVDVRAKGMYDAGHIPGAISLPETSSPEEFTAFLNQHPTNLTLIVYCSSTSCSQSARVAGRLVNQYQRPSVKFMTGGYLEYQQEQARNQAGTTP